MKHKPKNAAVIIMIYALNCTGSSTILLMCMVFILYYFELIYNKFPHVFTYTFCCVYLIKINHLSELSK